MKTKLSKVSVFYMNKVVLNLDAIYLLHKIFCCRKKKYNFQPLTSFFLFFLLYLSVINTKYFGTISAFRFSRFSYLDVILGIHLFVRAGLFSFALLLFVLKNGKVLLTG